MSLLDYSAPPKHVDRLVVHQFDPARPSPGGIDTCLRGICRYLPAGHTVAIIGVDTGAGEVNRELGKWERRRVGDNEFWFLPAARLDPADQARRIPHVIRLLAGIIRFRRRLPRARTVQVHRMDAALALSALVPAPQVYMVHTQENGLVGATSDSFWRFLGGAHRALERRVVRKARCVVVFNRDYAEVVRRWNPRTLFSPTWYDPKMIVQGGRHSKPNSLIWVGRLETPKDPVLAVRVVEKLARSLPDAGWTLDVLGSGTLDDEVRSAVQSLSPQVRERVTLHGRVAPEAVAEMMSEAGVFLMTSHPGYEGYPRVLVEAMASGLPAVVTHGSDTGGLVVDGVTGFTGQRNPEELASLVRNASLIPRKNVVDAVAELQAPTLIKRIFDAASDGQNTTKEIS